MSGHLDDESGRTVGQVVVSAGPGPGRAWQGPAVLLLCVVALAAGTLWALPEGMDAASIRGHFASLGSWSVPLFVALFVVATLAVLPTSPLSVAAGYLYGPWVGAVVAWAGAMVGGAASFGLGRRARGPVHAWLHRRLRRTARLLEGHPFMAVLASRLLMAPHGAVSYAFGMAGIPVRPFLAATAIGMAPLAIAAAVGGEFAAAKWELSMWVWFAFLGAVLMLAAGAWYGARWAKGARA